MLLILLRYIKLSKFEFTLNRTRSPYVTLLAIIIFCLKLIYGLDDFERYIYIVIIYKNVSVLK